MNADATVDADVDAYAPVLKYSTSLRARRCGTFGTVDKAAGL